MIIETFVLERDLEPVVKLWANSGPGIQLARSDTEAEIRKKLTRDPELFLVARDGNQLLGAVLGGYDGRRGMVYHLAIEERCRKQGIGTVLMAELENRLSEKGCLKYYFLVRKGNNDAIEFYSQIGCELMDLYVMGKVIG